MAMVTLHVSTGTVDSAATSDTPPTGERSADKFNDEDACRDFIKQTWGCKNL